jgi:predicted anti-sigma-YlaC factor YlaD
MMRLLTTDLVCQQAVELVTDYLEGRLSRRQKRRFEAHLAVCPHCRAYLEQIKTTIELSGQIEPDSLTPEGRETLLDMYRRFHSDAADD